MPTREVTINDKQGFNRRFFSPNLERVWVPTNGQELVDALQEAKDVSDNFSFRIVAGRHAYEAFVYTDRTLNILDVSGLRGIGVDPTYGYYIESGNQNWDVQRTLINVYNRTIPGGTCFSVGIGGHITGGGYGPLSRLHGATIDWLTGVDIVVLRGFGAEMVHCSATENPDLFWAVRGAGGNNYGVIYRYYFAELPIAPSRVYRTNTTYNWSKTSPSELGYILNNFVEDGCDQAPESWSIAANMGLIHVANGTFGESRTAYYDDSLGMSVDEYEKWFRDRQQKHNQRLRNAGIKTVDTQVPMPGHPWEYDLSSLPKDSEDLRKYTYLEAVQTGSGSGPNSYGKYKSAYQLDAFTQYEVDTIYKWLHTYPPGQAENDWDMTRSLVQLAAYGGKVNEVGYSDTAMPQRTSIMKHQPQTYWDNAADVGSGGDPDQNNAHINWINDFYSELWDPYGGTPDPDGPGPANHVDGCYVNYPDIALGELADREKALHLYFLDNLRGGPNNTSPYTLVQIKNDWDPLGFFWFSQSIPNTFLDQENG